MTNVDPSDLTLWPTIRHLFPLWRAQYRLVSVGLACALAVAPEPSAVPATGTAEARPGLTADLFERATTALGRLGAATSA